MKKSNIAGWQDVFLFTLKQTLKSKSFIVSYVILIVLAIISMPIAGRFLSGTGETKSSDAPSPINKVYVNNQTKLPDMDFTGQLPDKTLSNMTFVKMQENYDTVSDRIETQENTSVILTVADQAGTFSLSFVKASKGPVNKTALQQLGNAVAEQFKTFRINTLGISQDQLAMINAPINTAVSMADVNGVPIMKENTSISGSEYWFIYGITVIILMVNMMASSLIATSIVTEKASRVIEYLLISIKPLALIVGKVIAMLAAVLLEMASLVAVFFVSNIISANISGNGKSILSQYLTSNIFENLNLVNIIICFLLMLLGLIFYATLAGLAGATVSKLEEIQEGLTLFTLVSLVGAYLGFGAAGVLMANGENSFVTFTLLFPLSSPFILPGALLTGKASLLIVAGAAALQIIFIALLFKFVAKVFETLILHTGNTIKPNELIKIFKTV